MAPEGLMTHRIRRPPWRRRAHGASFWAMSIELRSKGSTRIITLNRADKLNAFDEAMHLAFQEALDRVAQDPECRAVLLTGTGRAFSVGQDLAEVDPARMDGPPELGRTIDRFYNPMIRKLRAIEVPVVCAVNGVAAGAGANIALACDLVLAARSARFIQAFAKIGLVPDSGGTWSLVRHLGPARAMALALTGEPLSAEKAEAWGLIWRVVDDEALAESALSLVDGLAQGPTHGLKLTKRALRAASENGLDAQLDLERALQDEAGRNPDYAEGIVAFMNKRPPQFTGGS